MRFEHGSELLYCAAAVRSNKKCLTYTLVTSPLELNCLCLCTHTCANTFNVVDNIIYDFALNSQPRRYVSPRLCPLWSRKVVNVPLKKHTCMFSFIQLFYIKRKISLKFNSNFLPVFN